MWVQNPQERGGKRIKLSLLVAVIFCTESDAYLISYKYSYRSGPPRAFGHRYAEFPDPAKSSGLTQPVEELQMCKALLVPADWMGTQFDLALTSYRSFDGPNQLS